MIFTNKNYIILMSIFFISFIFNCKINGMKFSELDFSKKNELTISKKALRGGLKADKFSYIRLKRCYKWGMESNLYNAIGITQKDNYSYITLRPGDSLGIENDIIIKKSQKNKYLELIPQNSYKHIILYRGGSSCPSYIIPGALVVTAGLLILNWMYPTISITL